jgi:outer membrane protein insertion porin family
VRYVRGVRRFLVVCLGQLVLAATARAQPADATAADPGSGSDVAPPEQPPSETPNPPLHEDNEFGPVILIESIEITGNTATGTELIRRALPINPGDILHASDKRLRDSRYKVLALGYFRDVQLAMKKGSARGQVIIEIHVVERGTFVLNQLWFGSNSLSPYWFGADVGERNLLGLGIAVGGGLIYAADGHILGDRDQWAGELRAADTSLYGSRFGANGSLTLVHGSEPYRIGGTTGSEATDFNAFPYSRIGGRLGMTYDVTELSRISAGVRVESLNTTLPVAPTRTLPDGEITAVDLHLLPGESRVVTASVGFDHDTRPDPILPHTGDHLAASAEIGSAAIGSSYDYLTIFARYERWMPLRNERSAIGLRLAGGVVIGNAPRFDRIYVSDVDHMLTPRALGLVLSNAAPLDILGTDPAKPSYGEVGGSATLEFTSEIFRGTGKNRVFGADWFVGAGLWGLAQTDQLTLRDSSVWQSLPVDVYLDAGVRIDTDLGVFEVTLSNALGRVR